MRELRNKFVFTDYLRASKIVRIVNQLDFVQEIFIFGDKTVPGCTPLTVLLQDSGDGKVWLDDTLSIS